MDIGERTRTIAMIYVATSTRLASNSKTVRHHREVLDTDPLEVSPDQVAEWIVAYELAADELESLVEQGPR